MSEILSREEAEKLLHEHGGGDSLSGDAFVWVREFLIRLSLENADVVPAQFWRGPLDGEVINVGKEVHTVTYHGAVYTRFAPNCFHFKEYEEPWQDASTPE